MHLTLTKILISEEFFEYLQQNGYTQYISLDPSEITFHNGRDLSVAFKHDRMSFWMQYDGSDDEAPEYKQFGAIDGVSQLNLFGFMMVLDAFNMVKIPDFVFRAKAGDSRRDMRKEIAAALSQPEMAECH